MKTPAMPAFLLAEMIARVQLRVALTLLALVGSLTVVPLPALAACPERPACHGCGCKGGPGYRAPDGRCVGFTNLTKVCGAPPEQSCTFENAPGTGLNRDCALGLDQETIPDNEETTDAQGNTADSRP